MSALIESVGAQVTARRIEVFAAILLGVGTLGSAWCAVEASRWNGDQGDATREGNTARIESTRSYTFATQVVAYDATIAAQYAEAVAEGSADLQQFYRTNLIRSEFLPVLDAWRAQTDEQAFEIRNLFENSEYIDSQFEASRRLDDEARQATERAQRAGQYADDYVLTTLFMATVLFFAGVTTHFSTLSVRVGLLVVACVMLAIGAVKIFSLPVT